MNNKLLAHPLLNLICKRFHEEESKTLKML